MTDYQPGCASITHTIGCHNIDVILHGLFHPLCFYSCGKPSINFIPPPKCCQFVALCCVTCLGFNYFFRLSFYLTENKSRRSTVSSTSAHTSHRIRPFSQHLPFCCTMLCNMLGVQLVLQAQFVPHREQSWGSTISSNSAHASNRI